MEPNSINFDFTLFESNAVLPSRSHLYRLPMRGLGSADQEALLGYVHRLALAHGVRISHLLASVILPKGTDSKEWQRGIGSRRFLRTVNGYNKYAAEMAQVLSVLTQANALSQGTLTPWQGLFDPSGSGLLHLKKHWCPECIADDLELGVEPTFKLLWAVACITHCPQHQVRLALQCKVCEASQSFVSDAHASGRCDRCANSLGWRADLKDQVRATPCASDLFKMEAVSQMIAIGSEAEKLACPQILSKQLSAIASKSFNGSVLGMAKSLGVHRSGLDAWIRQECKPRFSTLIELCYRLGTTPVELLSDENLPMIFMPRSEITPLGKRNQRLTAAQLNVIEQAIHAVFQSGHCAYRSFKEFALQHNTSAKYLQRRLPQAYDVLVTHLADLRAQRAEMRSVSRDRRAREVVRSLISTGQKCGASVIARNLNAANLSMACPVTRFAVRDELSRLRAGGVTQKNG